jgi:hypothetical protein
MNEQLRKCVGLSHFMNSINVMGQGKEKGRMEGERLERNRVNEDETVEKTEKVGSWKRVRTKEGEAE